MAEAPIPPTPAPGGSGGGRGPRRPPISVGHVGPDETPEGKREKAFQLAREVSMKLLRQSVESATWLKAKTAELQKTFKDIKKDDSVPKSKIAYLKSELKLHDDELNARRKLERQANREITKAETEILSLRGISAADSAIVREILDNTDEVRNEVKAEIDKYESEIISHEELLETLKPTDEPGVPTGPEDPILTEEERKKIIDGIDDVVKQLEETETRAKDIKAKVGKEARDELSAAIKGKGLTPEELTKKKELLKVVKDDLEKVQKTNAKLSVDVVNVAKAVKATTEKEELEPLEKRLAGLRKSRDDIDAILKDVDKDIVEYQKILDEVEKPPKGPTPPDEIVKGALHKMLEEQRSAVEAREGSFTYSKNLKLAQVARIGIGIAAVGIGAIPGGGAISSALRIGGAMVGGGMAADGMYLTKKEGSALSDFKDAHNPETGEYNAEKVKAIVAEMVADTSESGRKKLLNIMGTLTETATIKGMKVEAALAEKQRQEEEKRKQERKGKLGGVWDAMRSKFAKMSPTGKILTGLGVGAASALAAALVPGVGLGVGVALQAGMGALGMKHQRNDAAYQHSIIVEEITRQLDASKELDGDALARDTRNVRQGMRGQRAGAIAIGAVLGAGFAGVAQWMRGGIVGPHFFEKLSADLDPREKTLHLLEGGDHGFKGEMLGHDKVLFREGPGASGRLAEQVLKGYEGRGHSLSDAEFAHAKHTLAERWQTEGHFSKDGSLIQPGKYLVTREIDALADAERAAKDAHAHFNHFRAESSGGPSVSQVVSSPESANVASAAPHIASSVPDVAKGEPNSLDLRNSTAASPTLDEGIRSWPPESDEQTPSPADLYRTESTAPDQKENLSDIFRYDRGAHSAGEKILKFDGVTPDRSIDELLTKSGDAMDSYVRGAGKSPDQVMRLADHLRRADGGWLRPIPWELRGVEAEIKASPAFKDYLVAKLEDHAKKLTEMPDRTA